MIVKLKVFVIVVHVSRGCLQEISMLRTVLINHKHIISYHCLLGEV